MKLLTKNKNKNNFNLVRRLKGSHKTDMDLNQMLEHKFSKVKFGTGELRYLFQYRKGN